MVKRSFRLVNMEQSNYDILKNLIEHCSNVIESVYINKKGMIKIYLKNKNFNILFLYFLKYHSWLKFEQLMDIFGVDYLKNMNYLEVNYVLLSIQFYSRMLISLKVGEYKMVNSLINLYSSSGWLEREVWDMFGVFFKNNNDLRRILLDYGFRGYVLKKEYPIVGYLEIFYEESEKMLSFEPVNFSQSFRNFNILNPWQV